MKINQMPNQTKLVAGERTQEKVYWQDLPADARVIDKSSHYEVDGKLVYWNGNEAKQAYFWLGTHLSSKP